MKASFAVQLSQGVNITPQLLQSIRLLQLTGAELEAHVREALDCNPMLEQPEAGDAEPLEGVDGKELPVAEAQPEPEPVADVRVADDGFEPEAVWGAGGGAGPESDGDDEEGPVARIAAAPVDVREHVRQQLALMLSDPREIAVSAWLVDQVDDAGYLEHDPDALAGLQPEAIALPPARLESLRQLMMGLDPAGYGARDLRECLLAQLAAIEQDAPSRTLAMRIVANHLPLLAAHDHKALAAVLECSVADVAVAERLVLSLDPRPGERFAAREPAYVVPDVLVTRDERGWKVELNGAVTPRVRVNRVYEGMLGRCDNGASARTLRDLLQEARWLVRALAMRHETLMKVAHVIVSRQRAFLERGAEAMQPLTLREVADAIGMHESTVSRITTGKYMQTPRGTLELKFFFSNRLQGAEVSGVAIRAMVKRLIDSENPSVPLADDMIAALLARQGVRIARRTVAKYRDLLRIASAKDRRRDSVSPAAASFA
jgi:RNA polymerase sigma-54 factor